MPAHHPGLSAHFLEDARLELRHAEAVLGPAEDGSFYLLGLKRCPPRLLAGLPWNHPETFAHTLARLREHGIATRVLEPWAVAHLAPDLEGLEALLRSGRLHAPETARVLAEIRKTVVTQ